MTFAFPAYHRETIEPNDPGNNVHARVLTCLSGLKWSVSRNNPSQIQATTSVNLWSWGEKIVIDIAESGTLSITSKCSLPTQCFDWGKNKNNVRAFAVAFHKQDPAST